MHLSGNKNFSFPLGTEVFCALVAVDPWQKYMQLIETFSPFCLSDFFFLFPHLFPIPVVQGVQINTITPWSWFNIFSALNAGIELPSCLALVIWRLVANIWQFVQFVLGCFVLFSLISLSACPSVFVSLNNAVQSLSPRIFTHPGGKSETLPLQGTSWVGRTRENPWFQPCTDTPRALCRSQRNNPSTSGLKSDKSEPKLLLPQRI